MLIIFKLNVTKATLMYGLICCMVLSQISNAGEAENLFTTFNNFKYDKVAVDDA